MNRVCVLLSTYNGEKYIKDQIESLLAQENVDIYIIVRDDGSKDNTLKILKEFELNYPNKITILNKENIGCEASFFELLSLKIDADYYAFCDQDDVWDKYKLAKEIVAIKDKSKPAVVSCNLMVCDEKLNHIGEIYNTSFCNNYENLKDRDILLSFHGCTLLWNQSLHKYIQQNKPFCNVAHDVWVSALGNSLGNMYFLNESLVNYRQHDGNVSGYGLDLYKKIISRIKLYFGKNHPQRDSLARYIINNYENDITNDKKILLNEISNYKTSLYSKVRFVKTNIFLIKPRRSRLFWSICVLLGKY